MFILKPLVRARQDRGVGEPSGNEGWRALASLSMANTVLAGLALLSHSLYLPPNC